MMLQVGFGVTPATSGMLTFASAAGAILMKMTAARLIRIFGFRKIFIVNALINTVFLMSCALFTPGTPHMVIFALLLSGGFFRSLQFTALNTFAYAEMPASLISRANTLYSMLQQLTLSLGVAVGALLLNLTLIIRGDSQLGPYDFWPAFIGIGILSLLSILFYTKLPPNAGDELSGRAKVAMPVPTRHEDPAV
jgi:MFS family permease